MRKMLELISVLGYEHRTIGGDYIGRMFVVVLSYPGNSDTDEVVVFTTRGAMENWLESGGKGRVAYEALMQIRAAYARYCEDENPLPENSKLPTVRFSGSAAMYMGTLIITNAIQQARAVATDIEVEELTAKGGGNTAN